jgi:integrase
VRTLFNWAINRSIYDIEASPVDRVKPKDLLGARAVRERILSDDELRALWKAAVDYPFGSIVRMLMLTGARLNEVAGARWPEFNGAVWTVPKERFKAGSEHRVPITRDMRALLDGLPRWANSDFLFSTGRGQFSNIAKSKAILPLRDWTLHDIRRTVVTGLQKLKVPLEVTEAILNHRSGSITGVAATYHRHDFLTEGRNALYTWADHVASLVGEAVGPPASSADSIPLAEAHAA